MLINSNYTYKDHIGIPTNIVLAVKRKHYKKCRAARK